MARVADEQEILDKAILAFHRATGVGAEILHGRAFTEIPGKGGRERPDAGVRIHRAGKELTFDAEVKPWLTTATVGLLAQNHRHDKKRILVTRYAHQALAEQMRALQIQFMDTEGNAFIDTKDLFVFVKGLKPANQRARGGFARPFKPAGMQVIFALICNPGLEQKTYRDIAAVTKTALGTIDWTMQDLRQAGHMLNMKNAGRRIVNKDGLFDKWVAAYPQQLKPKCMIGRYDPPAPDWWRTAKLKDINAQWGGETAAAIVTGHLRPEIATVYVAENPNDLIVRFKLRKDPNGKIELLRKFWHFDLPEQKGETVPLPLIYADLLATGNDRNIETATILREKALDRYLK